MKRKENKHMKRIKAYTFWYLLTSNSTTEYVNIIALSYKQAKYFWFNYLKYELGFVYDYDLDPCNIIESKYFTKSHDVGDILGRNAII